MLTKITEQLFLEHFLAMTEGCNDFDIPYCYFKVSDAEISFNFLFLIKKKGKLGSSKRFYERQPKRHFEKKIDCTNWYPK